MTLRTRFVFYVAGLTVGSFVLYAGALSWTQREYLIKEQNRANVEESHRWTLLCEQSIFSKDEITLVHYVRELSRSGDVRWASFLSEDGHILMHTDLRLKNTRDVHELRRWSGQMGRFTQMNRAGSDGEPLTVLAGPVSRRGEQFGVALLAFDRRLQTERMRVLLGASLRRFAGATLLCLAIGVGMAFVVARGLVRPLQELTGAVRRLGAGDWKARPAVFRRDEIGQLASAFAEMSRRLARLDELKDEFVATVSHDLRNPLGAITMAARYLVSPPSPLSAETGRQVLGTILISTSRLRNMVDNLLDAAKIKEGPLSSLREAFSVVNVLQELHDLFRAQAEEFGRVFCLRVPEDFPMVIGDEAQTYRILSNLLANAFKFTAAGDRITLSALSTPEGRVAIEVSDSGPGISPEDLSRLFLRFQTAENAGAQVKKKQGTGLGLAIAKALAESQNGTLTVESELHRGTTFRVTLPQWRAS
ncbi:MAG: HAMP domain-containing histidine kinase [Elusimicrobia bacterium]|nr:HAMP domain-containing histidine kinase [Elusimicrobiota bacterium]